MNRLNWGNNCEFLVSDDLICVKASLFLLMFIGISSIKKSYFWSFSSSNALLMDLAN